MGRVPSCIAHKEGVRHLNDGDSVGGFVGLGDGLQGKCSA